jgi:hypothetical protein
MVGSPMISDYIIRVGYTAFYEVLISNHRGLYIDKFYGTKNPDSTKPAACLLKSTDRKAVARYLKHVKANIKTCEKVLQDNNETAESLGPLGNAPLLGTNAM